MSHLMTVQSIIRDPVALARACECLGWSLYHDAQPRLWSSNGPTCTYVVAPADHPRSIGLQATGDGSYRLVCDSMDKAYAGQLTQAYNYAVIEAEAVLAGMNIGEQVTLADGTISLYVEGY